MKKLESVGFRVCCGWRHEWGRFLAILAQVTWPWAPTARGNVLTESGTIGSNPGWVTLKTWKSVLASVAVTFGDTNSKCTECGDTTASSDKDSPLDQFHSAAGAALRVLQLDDFLLALCDAESHSLTSLVVGDQTTSDTSTWVKKRV